MTRLLAFADTQLGVATVDLADQRAVLDRIVELALEREVDAVLHGGDVFEGPVVTPEQLRCFVDAMRPLAWNMNKIPLLVIRGNGRHDMAVREVNALDILREVDGIQIADSPTVAVLADKVAVSTLPWVHPGRLVASMNGALTHDEASETTAQMLVKIARHLHAQASKIQAGTFGDANLPTVLLAHWAISGSALPTGLSVDEMREPVLPWVDLDAIGYDAVIGAHIHQPQQISNPELDSTLGIVVGSPQQLNHGETGEHGCWIIDTLTEPDVARTDEARTTGVQPGSERRSTDEGLSGLASRSPDVSGSVSAEFVPIESREFVTFDITDKMGFFFDLDEALVDSEIATVADVRLSSVPSGTVPDGSIVRIRYQATEEQARRINHDSLRAAFIETGASRVTIEPQIIRKERARAQQISEQLSPLEALAAYCEANDMPTELSLRMLERLKEWSDT